MKFEESQYIELKEKYVEDIKKEVVAFANSDGGTIYVGIQNDGTILGVENTDQVSLQILNSCRDSIKPDIMMFIRLEILTFESKNIISIQVQKGTSRPYYLSNKGLKPSGVYVRHGPASSPASDQAIRMMIKESDGDNFENMRSLNQNLTFIELENTFKERDITIGITQMKSLGLINQDNIYTNLALLLSDQCPHIIKAATFNGSEQEEFQDRREFTGSLLKQLKDAYNYLDLRNQTRATFNGLLRTDSMDYSKTALREALLNAIIHRDYSLSASTLISVYNNRIEMVSYGGLPGHITLEDVLLGLSLCRNQKLANIFYRLNLIEAYGTGLMKINNAYTKFKQKPEFKATPNAFKVILPNMNTIEENNINIETNSSEKIIMNYIRNNGSISREQTESLININATAATRLLRKMKESKLIQPSGRGKNTIYILY